LAPCHTKFELAFVLDVFGKENTIIGWQTVLKISLKIIVLVRVDYFAISVRLGLIPLSKINIEGLLKHVGVDSGISLNVRFLAFEGIYFKNWYTLFHVVCILFRYEKLLKTSKLPNFPVYWPFVRLCI
jgi:hypothetical protein